MPCTPCKMIIVLLTVPLVTEVTGADFGTFTEVRRYDAPEAVQGVAVDAEHFYAIANSTIGKYDKQTGKLKKRWKASEKIPLSHLNSGTVRNGKLYCAHSNYPRSPEVSSIEIWDAESLKHIRSHSFGIYEGALTWIDWKDDSWWAVFAHYSKPNPDEDPHVKDNRWTSLVRFDSEWRRQAGWVFPQAVLGRFFPNSCSGGGWGPDEALYCTGHDRDEVYRLMLPKAGSTLRLTKTFFAPITGQGIAWDAEGKFLYGIDRKRRQVVVSRFTEQE